MTFSEIVEREFGDDWAFSFQRAANLLPAPCLLLPGGTESRSFLYLAKRMDNLESPGASERQRHP